MLTFNRVCLASLGVLLILVIGFSACGEKKMPTDPEGLSKRFMEIFYIERDADAAAQLSTGIAVYKITKRFQVPPGTQWSSSATKPKTKVKLLSKDQANENEISYHYQVTFNSPEITDREVFVNMRKVEDKWLVYQFIENKKVEKRSPSATPSPSPVL